MSMLIAKLPLQNHHRIALEQAVEYANNIVEPTGIVLSGSIVRGNPDASSDLDIVILHKGSWRRRIQGWFNGTPAELFFNSRDWLEYCIHDEAAHGRPVMAHMLSSGFLLQDSDGRMAELINTAKFVLSQGPGLSTADLLRERYAAACKVEDALDFHGVDTGDARQALALAVDAIVKYFYLMRNCHLPRPKERLSLLAETAPETAGLLSLALSEMPSEALVALKQASKKVLGVSGFFEWDSGWDNTLPPA